MKSYLNMGLVLQARPDTSMDTQRKNDYAVVFRRCDHRLFYNGKKKGPPPSPLVTCDSPCPVNWLFALRLLDEWCNRDLGMLLQFHNRPNVSWVHLASWAALHHAVDRDLIIG